MKKSELTRSTILVKAFELIYVNGYQSTSIDDIIATTNVTKGAFYYHFKTKEEMGIAVVREVMKNAMQDGFIQPLLTAENPLDAIYEMMEDLLLSNPLLQVKYGCPTYNMIQEMAPLNTHFKDELGDIIELVHQTVITAIERGQLNQTVSKEVEGAEVAAFIMSGYGGIRILGKLGNDKSIYYPYLKQLRVYLNALKY